MRKIPKPIYGEVSNDMSIEENIVKDVVDFAYKELKYNMGHGEHPYLYMIGLGTFYAKLPKLLKRIHYYENILYSNFRSDSDMSVRIYNRAVNSKDRLCILKDKIEAEMKRKYEVRSKYYEKIEKEVKKNIE